MNRSIDKQVSNRARCSRRATLGLVLSSMLLGFLGMLVSVTAHAEIETITYLHTDHLGSPILVRDQDGNTVWEQDYGPWGEPLTTTGSNPADVGYTGHYSETELNLTYAGARWYDPEVGRFLSPDAVGYLEGGAPHFNRYVYGANNPYLYVDPDGNASISVNLTQSLNLALKDGGLSFGASVGGSVGFAMSVPTPWDNGAFDIGVTVTRIGGSTTELEGRLGQKDGLNGGLGRATVGATVSKGAVLDLEGQGAAVTGTALVGGGHATYSIGGELTGIGIQGGAGLNLGSEGTVTEVYSLRRGVARTASKVADNLRQAVSRSLKERANRLLQVQPK